MVAGVAQGILQGSRVHVADIAQANRLHNKTAVGMPQAGNTLELSLVEAAWCVGDGKLQVKSGAKQLELGDLLSQAAGGGHRTEVDYLVYRDLRERGLVVRPAAGAGHFDVWPRGTGQGKPAYQVVARADRDPLTATELSTDADVQTVAAVVDDDGSITHYAFAGDDPTGDIPDAALPTSEGQLLADRVLITNPKIAASYAKQFIGRPQNDGVLLSLLEAESLHRRGLLTVQGNLAARAASINTHFATILPVYLDLRSRGVVAKSGFRFGTHLRGYRNSPDDDHAEWLIHCAGSGPLAWSDVSRGVRLAHGVRKKFLVALPNGPAPRYVHVSWFRP